MSEEPIKVVNFDGFISHVSDSGEDSEVIVYVAHVVSDDSRMRGGSEMGVTQDLCHVNNNDNDYGNMFTIRVGKCVERVAARDISENEGLTKVRLIDKGIDIEVDRNTLFPSTSRVKINNDCMCPILVVDAGEEQKEVAAQITGRECRCINGNLVVIPSVGFCVKGRLLISYGNGGYAELKDISLMPAVGQEEQDYSRFAVEDMPQPNANMSPPIEPTRPFRYRCNSITCRRNYFGNNSGRYEREEYSGVVDVYGNEAYTITESRFTNRWNNNQFHENSAVIENGVPFNRRNYNESFLAAKFDCGQEEMNHMLNVVSRRNVSYTQHSFKEYVPHFYPRTIRIRFDKIDSSSTNTFWAFEPNIFTTVEKVLHEGRQRYTACPQFDLSLVNELSGMGCLVKASVDSGYRSLCRAEIIKFANNTLRFSVYLVDYGFYKWVKCDDVFDISMISKRDKILYLPVALLHCRLEKSTNGILLQQLEKGSEYEITIKSQDSEGIFNVHINQADNNRGALANICDSVVPVNSDRNNNLLAAWCSCSMQFAYDAFVKAFQRNMRIDEATRENSLMSTMMANNMTFSNWPSICGFGIPYPMIMPIMMPTMPNFGSITNSYNRDRINAQFGRGDDARNGDRFSMNNNMRNSNRRGNDRFMNHETAMGSRYCAIERRGEFNYSNNFDERDNLQTRNAGNRNNGYWGNRNNNGYWGNRNNNGYWGNRNNGDWGNRNNGYWGGRRGERNGAFRGRRPGKYSHINAGGSNEARGYYSFDDAENHNVNKENKRGESAAYAGSSEWDLPPPRNQHANRFTRFNKNTH